MNDIIWKKNGEQMTAFEVEMEKRTSKTPNLDKYIGKCKQAGRGTNAQQKNASSQ